MGARQPVIVPLAEAGDCEEGLVGGKARTLGRLIDAGYRVPDGFCINVRAYDRLVESADLKAKIQMELGRKRFATMRWEEIWDAALRIRSAFLAAPMPADVTGPIRDAYRRIAPSALAVRSSAPGEDGSSRSHAGLHESLVGVKDEQGLLDAVRIVWASLWSDAALLYRQELRMDVFRSRMAVVVQEFVAAELSGVGFGIDPRYPERDSELVEAVPGPCEDLVSGSVDPDRWIMKRSTGEIVEWTPGKRGGAQATPILARDDLTLLHRTLRSVETLLECPPDVEWTGKSANLTLLQARPVTRAVENDEDERSWYLSLRPGKERLDRLCTRVTEDLIPQLEAEALRFATDDLEGFSDATLADAIEARVDSLDKWQAVYRDEFIPFAHGARRLGLYYNDAVRPDDPYEFVGLLKNQPMLASERNSSLARLASIVRKDDALAEKLARLATSGAVRRREDWRKQAPSLSRTPQTVEFCREFAAFVERYMNIVFDDESLDDRPDLALTVVLEMAREDDRNQQVDETTQPILEQQLLEAVGPDRRQEALDVLRIARLSWKLRDDDNILMGRLQNQLQHALTVAAERLKGAGRLDEGARVGPAASGTLIDALRAAGGGMVALPQAHPTSDESAAPPPGESPRQIIGQPAAPGSATGIVRVVREAADFARFRSGEVMVCDAIQPTMTHLVPLASAIVERRGGMLIHGAIIARELGVPCVNGVPDATRLLHEGDLVTVDGYLGIVTIGPAEFDLERGDGGELAGPTSP
ncbi:MAG: PEP/pyruvate-binding domain-containing protein [Planctomycetota bacterium]